MFTSPVYRHPGTTSGPHRHQWRSLYAPTGRGPAGQAQGLARPGSNLVLPISLLAEAGA